MADEELSLAECVEIARQSAKMARVFQRIHDVAIRLQDSAPALAAREQRLANIQTVIDAHTQELAVLARQVTEAQEKVQDARVRAKAITAQCERNIQQAEQRARLADANAAAHIAEVHATTTRQIENAQRARDGELARLEQEAGARRAEIDAAIEALEARRAEIERDLAAVVARVSAVATGEGH